MPDKEKVIEALEACVLKDPDDSRDCRHCPRCNYGAFITTSCINGVMADALALLKEYDEALKLMVYQYCTMKPLTVHDEVFHNKFMSAGEAAFRLLGLENGQSTDGVWERWFPNG